MAMQPPPVPPDPRKGPMPPPPVPGGGAPPQAARAAVAPNPNQPNQQPQAVPLPAGAAGAGAIELSVWQSPFVQNVLPFISSLLFHIALIVIGILTIKVVDEVSKAVTREQVIIPESDLAPEDGPVGGIPHPGLGGDPTKDAAQDKFPDVPKDSKGIAERPGPNLMASLTGGGGGEAEGAQLIGIGGGGIGAGAGRGSGKGEGLGGGDGDGSGVLAPFGVPGGGGGIGPKSSFVGVGGNARKIVYLCDASGTMLSVFDNLRVEMRKSIENLKPVQSFNIVFFSDDQALVLEKNGLVMATPDNKRKAFDFIEKSFARGTTNPMPAIKAAFASGPELVYCLTDGFDAVASFDEVAQEFRKHNTNNKVKVNTLLIESSDQPELVAILKRIAKENGGNFKAIKNTDW